MEFGLKLYLWNNDIVVIEICLDQKSAQSNVMESYRVEFTIDTQVEHRRS